jgi:hypothetical protein
MHPSVSREVREHLAQNAFLAIYDKQEGETYTQQLRRFKVVLNGAFKEAQTTGSLNLRKFHAAIEKWPTSLTTEKEQSNWKQVSSQRKHFASHTLFLALATWILFMGTHFRGSPFFQLTHMAMSVNGVVLGVCIQLSKSINHFTKCLTQVVTVAINHFREVILCLFSTRTFHSLTDVKLGLEDPDNSGIFSSQNLDSFWKFDWKVDHVLYHEMTPEIFDAIDKIFHQFLDPPKNSTVAS